MVRNKQILAAVLIGGLCFASQAAAYAFVSCTDYDEMEDVCYGYTRNYGYQAPLASHAYNLQDHLPAGVNQNITSVDPAIQNRTVSGTAFAAYPGFPMLTAAPGQNITITWPRTADPDGDSVTSPSVSVYYYPNATINAGLNFNKSQDPTLAQFQQHQLANLPFNENGTCAVIADNEKYDIAAHCRGTVQIPTDLENGIYTFLWYWIIHQPQLYRIYPQVFEVQVRAPPMLAGCASSAAYASPAAVRTAAAAPSASAGTATATSSAFRN